MATAPEGCQSALRLTAEGACWFRDPDRRDCAIHRTLGEPALASACRHFPRIVVLEPDQVSVSLSHYCPTAAAMLFRNEPGFALVESPRAFPADWPFEGLDARSAYSPLLRPGVLLGFDGLRALEAATVALFSKPGVRAQVVTFEAAVRRVREWTPASGAVPAFVARSFAEASALKLIGPEPQDPRSVLLASTPRGVPTLPALVAALLLRRDPGPEVDLALRRYLAARLIAGWVVFQAHDLAVVSRFLRFCLDTVYLFESARSRSEPEADRFREAIRDADLWILHHCDPELLAHNLR